MNAFPFLTSSIWSFRVPSIYPELFTTFQLNLDDRMHLFGMKVDEWNQHIWEGIWTCFVLLKSLKKSRCSDTFSFSSGEADLNAKASTSSCPHMVNIPHLFWFLGQLIRMWAVQGQGIQICADWMNFRSRSGKLSLAEWRRAIRLN